MTFLMVNMEDPTDCWRAIQRLQGQVGRRPGCGPKGKGEGKLGGWNPMAEQHLQRGPMPPLDGPNAMDRGDEQASIRELPLRAKLERMSQRGVWRHLVAVAKQGDVAKSLAEFDKELDLQPNKMRSLKAIMAKLENRFGLRFLEVDADAGNDEAGNPRYAMPHRVRKQILRIVAES